MLRKIQLVVIIFTAAYSCFLKGEGHHPPPLLVLGGGYLDAGCNHSGGIIQGEYRFGRTYYGLVRPQVSLLVPEFHSIFLGLGIGADLYPFRHIVITPTFSPGLYVNGKGKDLGCPLQFRSAIELAVELRKGVRLGFQVAHLSNASIGDHNPGFNTMMLTLGLPLYRRR